MKRTASYQIMAARIRNRLSKEKRKSPDDKLLAALLYHLGLSYRRVSKAMEDAFSHESKIRSNATSRKDGLGKEAHPGSIDSEGL